MIYKTIRITTDDKEEELELTIEFDNEDPDVVGSMTIKTSYQDKEIVAVGTHYPFEDAYSELQNKLPKNVRLKCCAACRHGNLCPAGNLPGEVFCTKDVEITCKSDLFYYTEDEFESKKRSRAFSDRCDDFCPQREDAFTYSGYLFFIKK